MCILLLCTNVCVCKLCESMSVSMSMSMSVSVCLCLQWLCANAGLVQLSRSHLYLI